MIKRIHNFRKHPVNTKVFDITYGWGTIIEKPLLAGAGFYQIICEFGGRRIPYTWYGARPLQGDIAITLFLNNDVTTLRPSIHHVSDQIWEYNGYLYDQRSHNNCGVGCEFCDLYKKNTCIIENTDLCRKLIGSSGYFKLRSTPVDSDVISTSDMFDIAIDKLTKAKRNLLADSRYETIVQLNLILDRISKNIENEDSYICEDIIEMLKIKRSNNIKGGKK